MTGLTSVLLVLPLLAAELKDLCVSHVDPEDGARLEATATKGVELYSWRVSNGMRFSLFWGTNRSKTDEEIKSATCVLSSVTEVHAALARLAPGEHVVWLNRESNSSGGWGDPPPQVSLALRDYAKSIGVIMEFFPPPRSAE